MNTEVLQPISDIRKKFIWALRFWRLIHRDTHTHIHLYTSFCFIHIRHKSTHTLSRFDRGGGNSDFVVIARCYRNARGCSPSNVFLIPVKATPLRWKCSPLARRQNFLLEGKIRAFNTFHVHEPDGAWSRAIRRDDPDFTDANRTTLRRR